MGNFGLPRPPVGVSFLAAVVAEVDRSRLEHLFGMGGLVPPALFLRI